jgi:hypothetical protein
VATKTRLTGTYKLPGGTADEGSIVIIPSEPVIKDTAGDVIFSGRENIKLDEAGHFQVDLPSTNDPDYNPTGFGYTVVAKLKYQHLPAVSFQLPTGDPVDMEDVTPVDPSTFDPTTTYQASAVRAETAATAAEAAQAEAEAAAAEAVATLASKASSDDLAVLDSRVDSAEETLAAAGMQREQPSGLAGLTSSGKIYEARVPERLSESAIEAARAAGALAADADPASPLRVQQDARLSATFAALLQPEKFGAKAAKLSLTGSVASGGTAFTDPNANFVPQDVGNVIVIQPTGYSSTHVTTIAARVSATQVTLATPAPSAVSNKAYLHGPDCTTALTDLAAAAVAGSWVYLSGAYIITGEGPTLPAVKITGTGTLTSTGTGASATPMSGSGIVSTSTTLPALIENGEGSVMEDFGVWNVAVTAPTAGAGIKVQAGTQGRKRNVLVSGFYDCVDYGSTSGRYWHMSACKVMDPVRYGVYIHNTTPSGDEGDMTIDGGSHFNTWSARTPEAAVRWESGGGLKFNGNKINQGMTGPKWKVGLDILAADNVITGVMPITGNSIENCTVACIRIGTLTANAGSSLAKIEIVGNEIAPFSSTADGIQIQPQIVWNFTDIVVNSNSIRDYGNGKAGLRVKNLDSWTCIGNRFRGSYHVFVEAGCSNFDIDNRTNGGGGIYAYNAAADNAAWPSRPVTITRGLTGITSGGTSRVGIVTMGNLASACLVEVTITGRMISGAGAGPVARKKKFWVSGNGAGVATVSAAFEDTNFSASTVDVVPSVATSAATFNLTHSDTGSTFRGNVKLDVIGPMFNVSE